MRKSVGILPTVTEYMEYAADIDTMADDIYRYLNFNQIESYQHAAEKSEATPITAI